MSINAPVTWRCICQRSSMSRPPRRLGCVQVGLASVAISIVFLTSACAGPGPQTDFSGSSVALEIDGNGRSTPAARHRLMQWQTLIDRYAEDSEPRKLDAVNRFFNRLRHVRDTRRWDKRDYWATPIEFLVAAAGDCEDFSFAKYHTLRQMGVPAEKMRILYVRARQIRSAHTVLAYYATPTAEPLILDNLTKSIQPDSRRQDLSPIFGFNEDGVYQISNRRLGVRISSTAVLAPWRDLMQRMEREKLSR